MKNFFKQRLASILLVGVAVWLPPVQAEEAVDASTLVGEQLEKYVARVLENTGVNALNLRNLIITRSDDIQAVIDGAVAAGVTDNMLVEECYLALPKELIPDFVRSAINAQAPPAEMLEACMNAVPVEESFDVVFSAMQAADPLQLGALIRVAIAHYGTEDFDGNQILVSSLIAGDFLNPDLVPAGCSSACMEEIAQNTLEFLAELQAPLEPSAVITEIEEPPLSES